MASPICYPLPAGWPGEVNALPKAPPWAPGQAAAAFILGMAYRWFLGYPSAVVWLRPWLQGLLLGDR